MRFLLNILLILICGLFAWLTWGQGRFCDEPQGALKRASVWSRWRLPGAVVGGGCLVWSAWHGCLMLEGPLMKYHPVVWALVPVTAVLSWFFLDYIFARALGGLLVLLANELIRQAFVYAVPCRGLYSVVCLLLGCAGLFLIGVPWRMRDTLELAAQEQWFRRMMIAGTMIAALVLTLGFF